MALGEAPADHLAGVVVQDDPNVRPLAAHADVAHVPHPDLVPGTGRWLVQQQVRCLRKQVVAMPVVFEAPGHARFEAIFPHDPRHPVFAADDVPGLQGRMDSGIAVGLAAGFEYLKNLLKQLPIIHAPLAVLPVPPGIVAAAGDPELPAQGRHRTPVLVFGYEPERGYFFSGKNLSAFFNITFSSRSCFSWRSNVRILALASSSSVRERASWSLSSIFPSRISCLQRYSMIG